MTASQGAIDITWEASDDGGGSGVQNYDWCITAVNNDCSVPARFGTTIGPVTTVPSGAFPALADGLWYSCVLARDFAMKSLFGDAMLTRYGA